MTDQTQTVKAYYECAYYRFVDTVGASVHCELFEKCRKDITKEMKKVFRLTEASGRSCVQLREARKKLTLT